MTWGTSVVRKCKLKPWETPEMGKTLTFQNISKL